MGFHSSSCVSGSTCFFQHRTYISLLLTACMVCFMACQGTTGPKVKQAISDDGTIQLPQPSALTAAEKQQYHNAVAGWYDSMLKPGYFNGGILVAKGGNIVFERYQGRMNVNSGDSITAASPFHIASVSKTFTSAAILLLKEAGKLDLQDPIEKYFPLMDYPGLTIQSLLTHRSGLPNYEYFLEYLGFDKKGKATNADVLQALTERKAEIKNIEPANRHFSYSNTNYALLALVIEKLGGMPYPQFLQENIFTPLQMNNSFVYSIADTADQYHSYTAGGRMIPRNFLDYIYGDKNIYSTPRDLLRWDRALSAHLILHKETLDTAYMPYSNEKQGIKNYGFGWRMNIYPNGKKVVFHNGWWHGNNAAFVRLPDEDATIIVLGNRKNRNIYRAYRLVNSFGHYFQGEDTVE